MQILTYPLMAKVGSSAFVDHERAHNARFVGVVGPTVVVVVVTTVVLFFSRPAAVPLGAVIAAAVLVLVIIGLTVAFQTPAHTRLALGFDLDVHARLVRTNWGRTVAWTVLGLLDLWLLARMIAA